MLRFVVRRIPKFGLQTLFAAMLLFVSVARAWRYGADPERQENEALKALESESLRYTAYRASGRYDDRAPAVDSRSNPIDRFAKWLVGANDPIERIDVRGLPTPETRAKLLALPALRRLGCTPRSLSDPWASASTSCPRPESVYGPGLPDFEIESAGQSELPPVPEGIPLNESERQATLHEMTTAWESPAEFPADRFLCHTIATRPMGARTVTETVLTAVEGEDRWRLHHEGYGVGSTAYVWTASEGRSVAQVWEDDAWRSCAFARGVEHSLSDFGGLSLSPPTYLGSFHPHLFEHEPAKLFDSIERLEDGTLKLTIRPREFAKESFRTSAAKLVEGFVVVDPAHGFVVYDLKAQVDDPNSLPWKVRYVFDYARVEGRYVPVRRRELADYVSPPSGAQKPAIVEGRYAWDFDPTFPHDLFDPTRDGGEFFTSTPTPRFPWWYVTGAIGLSWFYLLVSRRIRERWGSKKRGKLPSDAAMSGDGMDDRVGAAAGG